MGTIKNGGCQVIGEGAGNDFRGPSVQALPHPSLVSLLRARSLFRPLLPSACYAGYCETCPFCHGNNADSKLYSSFLCILSIDNFYHWIAIMEYSEHGLSTINMLQSLEKLSSYSPTSPSASYFCPRGGRCGEGRLYIHFWCVFWR